MLEICVNSVLNELNSLSISCNKRASPGLSSIRSTWIGGLLIYLLSLCLWQSDLRQPEIIDALYEGLKLPQLHGLTEVTVGLELIAFCDVRLRLRRGQDDCWDRFQAVILFDVSQHLAA